MTKDLSKNITSYDLLKSLAVVLMVADHIGFYFYPDQLWWRVTGRLCVPIWFFFIGYARSRDIGPRLWIGMLMLVAANFLAGMSILPLNILATVLAVRLLLDKVIERMRIGPSPFWGLALLMSILIFPTGMGVEYGTQALILAIFGLAVRYHQDYPGSEANAFMTQAMVLAAVTFLGSQWLMFGFSQPQTAVLVAGTIIIMSILIMFRAREYPGLTRALPVLSGFVKTTGRRTMDIYVIHLLLFKGLGLWLEPGRFVFLDWKWFSPTGL